MWDLRNAVGTVASAGSVLEAARGLARAMVEDDRCGPVDETYRSHPDFPIVLAERSAQVLHATANREESEFAILLLLLAACARAIDGEWHAALLLMSSLSIATGERTGGRETEIVADLLAAVVERVSPASSLSSCGTAAFSGRRSRGLWRDLSEWDLELGDDAGRLFRFGRGPLEPDWSHRPTGEDREEVWCPGGTWEPRALALLRPRPSVNLTRWSRGRRTRTFGSHVVHRGVDRGWPHCPRRRRPPH